MNISIKTPCHENWQEMASNQQGAFCGKCVKTVVDFSTKTIEEIKEFFNTTQEQKVCGRFETSQLTSLSFDDFYSKFNRFHFSKRIAIIVCLTFGAWLFGANSAFAQTPRNNKPTTTEIHMKGDVAYEPETKDTIKKCVKTPDDKTIIMGKVAPTKNPKDTLSNRPKQNAEKTDKRYQLGAVIAVPTNTVKPKSVKKK